MKIKIKIQVHSITDNNLGLILTKLHLFLCKSMKDVFFNHKLRFTYWMRFFWCMRAFCKALHLNPGSPPRIVVNCTLLKPSWGRGRSSHCLHAEQDKALSVLRTCSNSRQQLSPLTSSPERVGPSLGGSVPQCTLGNNPGRCDGEFWRRADVSPFFFLLRNRDRLDLRVVSCELSGLWI